MTDQPPLFDHGYTEPVDTSTLVTRMPGTIDAACICDPAGDHPCAWPFCDWEQAPQ